MNCQVSFGSQLLISKFFNWKTMNKVSLILHLRLFNVLIHFGQLGLLIQKCIFQEFYPDYIMCQKKVSFRFKEIMQCHSISWLIIISRYRGISRSPVCFFVCVGERGGDILTFDLMPCIIALLNDYLILWVTYSALAKSGHSNMACYMAPSNCIRRTCGKRKVISIVWLGVL